MTIAKDDVLIMDRLVKLATGPLLAARQDEQQVQAKLDKIGNNRCNGSISWRKDGPTERMIIVHKHGQVCPRHGQPKSRKGRIRTYIGTDEEKQALARELIANSKRYQDLESTLHRIDYAICAAYRHIKDYYQTLGYSIPWQPCDYPEARDRKPW